MRGTVSKSNFGKCCGRIVIDIGKRFFASKYVIGLTLIYLN